MPESTYKSTQKSGQVAVPKRYVGGLGSDWDSEQEGSQEGQLFHRVLHAADTIGLVERIIGDYSIACTVCRSVS